MSDAAGAAICPCGEFVHPAVIFNPPGLAVIAYRVGDYTAFREALLQARPGETALTRDDGSRLVQVWRPGGSGDLAVQMIEWWAYLADVLTFYNERVASQAYLRTAELPESVGRLIRLLGYRPRPGLGGAGVLAALANGPTPFTLPADFQIQSKPGPGKTPQVFELTTDTTVGLVATGPATGPQGELPVLPVADPAAAVPVQSSRRVLLQGAAGSLKKGDRLMFLSDDASPVRALATVLAVRPQQDLQAGPVTQVTFGADGDLSAVQDVTRFRLLKSEQSVSVWQYPADGGKVVRPDSNHPQATLADLQSIVRGLKIGDPLLFESGGTSQLAGLVSLTEAVWYANPDNYSPSGGWGGVDPAVPPSDPTKTLPIPIPHTSLAFTPALADYTDNAASRAQALVWYGWKDVGTLVVPASASVGGTASAAAPAGTAVTLQPPPGASPLPQVSGPTAVLVEDAVGNGASGTLAPTATPSSGTLTLDDPVPILQAPLRALFNLLAVTRGKTVANEVLGNGNAALAGQDFTLRNAPVTYLQDPASLSGDDYSSTVRVWVNNLQWTEVRSFYAQPTTAQVFVTREDEQGSTHVLFGDGEFGARLPTGVNNVVATYRYGSGAQVPPAGSLTVVLQPQPGLKSIRNPVPVGGGADPDPPAKIRQLAPRSVLAFNRAVSAEDYETIAVQAPGVARAKASFTFDPAVQRPRVKIWVGDTPAAVQAARAAIAGAADPNRLPGIEPATGIVIRLTLTLVLDPRAVPASVYTAVHDALLDPDAGLLGVNVVGIGQAFYDSQIYAACLAVPGVQGVNNYLFSTDPPTGSAGGSSACQSQSRHDPGEGGYFSLPDDGAHLTILPPLAP